MIEDSLFRQSDDKSRIYYQSSDSIPVSSLNAQVFHHTDQDVPLVINEVESQLRARLWYEDEFFEVTDIEKFSNNIRFRHQVEVERILQETKKTSKSPFSSDCWGYLKFLLENRDNDLEDLLKELFKNYNLKQDIELKVISNIELGVELNLKDISVVKKQDVFYIFRKLNENIHFENLINAVLTYLSLIKTTDAAQTLKNINSILGDIEFPVAIIDQKASLINCNELFTKANILPRDLLNNEQKNRLRANSIDYSFVVSKFNNSMSIFVLKPLEERDSTSQGKELGIITGSIAHELNNPVAGILAAITLLELENWDQENLKLLRELKDSSLRCKALIDTFLGFSRSGHLRKTEESLGEIIKQAVFLVRYRMIESGYTLKIDVDDEVQLINIKSSVMTMVLYIIFNELITLSSHNNLISNSEDKVLNLRFAKKQDNLLIKTDEINFNEKSKAKFENKLIDHLLDFDNIALTIETEEIVLKEIFK